MADEIITLSPEQEAQYNAATTSQPSQPTTPAQPEDINPLRDLDANQIFELAVQDPDNFDIAAEFARQPDLHGDQAQVQKAADALHLLRQRGFSLSDLPGPRKIAGAAAGIVKGFGKQALNYLTAGVNVGSAMVSDLMGKTGTADALLQESQRRIAENLAGTESAVTGLSEMAQRGAGKIARGIGISKSLEDFTPEDKVKELFDTAGKIQNQQEIAQGKGAFLTGVGGEVIKELEQAGKPVRPEEVAELAPGDPFSWWTFGKALGQTGRLVPTPVKAAAARVGEKAGEIATVAGGKTVQALGEATRLTAKGVEKAAPAVGLVKGAAEAGPLGALAGLKAGELVRPITRRLGAAGTALATVGKDIAAGGVAPTAAAQLGRDVIQSIPGVAGGFAHGAAMDVGLAAVTSESPAETEASVGLGATLGGLGGARRAGQRILSGQLIAPRNWGSNTPVPSSGNFKPLDAMHSVAYATAEPAVRQRVNAIREFVNGAAPGTDVFLAKDSSSIEKALLDSGVDPAIAKSFSEQQGFFTADLGNGRRVVVIQNAEAAPHEAFHAFQDVIGEQANRVIDKIMQDTYADRWEAEGQKYAERLTGKPTTNWRDAILDSSRWGHAEAMEKLSREAANKLRAQTGAEPNSEDVQELVRQAWSQAQGNPREAWREILTPEEQIAVADRYIARELAAENFDAVFKNLGGSLQDQPGVIPALARIVGKTVEAFGGEPLATRTSEFGAVPLRTPAVEAVRGAVVQRRPVVQPRPEVRPAPVTPTPTTPTTPTPVEEAQQIAAEAPTTPAIAGGKSPRELLGAVAEAIAQQAGVKINYLSAPGEPAAATTSNRAARREIIETFRTMPPEARALWEKTFFPERIFKRKDKYQIFGWAPEVFASNAHKMAAALKDTTLSPYPIDPATGSFTEAGWKQLFDDTQTFVRNQMAGQTGAGEALVVPKGSQPGIFAPASRPSEAKPLDQTKADFINMLFNSRLPDTPRLTKGKPSLNIAGQEVSEATKPGRVQKPVVARDPFTGPEAEARGISGREILEVNPLRNEITAALGDKMPSLIEANQLLNLENIKEVVTAPEQPQFRANTLTLAAGFQPKPEEPRAIRTAAVKFPSGKVYEGPIHSLATELGIASGEVPGVKAFEELNSLPLPEYTKFFTSLQDGFVTNGGDFLTREQAFQRARELKQITEQGAKEIEQSLGREALESFAFDEARQFQPIAERAQSIKDMTDEQWNREVQNFKGTIGSGPTGWGFDLGSKAKTADDVSALKSVTETLQEITRAAMREKDFDTVGRLATRQQIAHEAYQAATGEKLDGTPAAVDFIRRHYKPDYQPPVPGESFKKWDAEQPDAAERAALEKQFDIPPESGSIPKMAAQPKKRKDVYKLPKGSSGGFKKAWVLPNGEVQQLGGTWHHEWLAENPEIAKKYGLTVPEFTGNDAENVREDALRKGFIRVNYGINNGTLVLEGRAKDWRKIKSSMEQMVESNIDDVDNVTVHLFDDKIERVLDSETRRLFVHDNDADKMANLPFSEREPRGIGASSAQSSNAKQLLARLMDDPESDYYMSPAAKKKFKEDGSYDKTVEMSLEQLREEMGQGRTQFQPERKRLAGAGFFFENMRRGIFADELRKVREGKSGGQTFNPDGSIWNAESPSDIVTLASVNIPADSLTPEAYAEATAPYKELLSRPGVVTGVFSFTKDDKPTVSIDINAVVPKEFRDNSLAFAKANDQVSIWDAEKSETVEVGGKGNTRLTDPDDLSVIVDSLVAGEPVDFPAEQTSLFGDERPRPLSNAEVGKLSRAGLQRQYPEAVVPQERNEKIPSNILESPLYRQSKNEADAVKAFAAKLVEFAKENQDRPEYKLGERWYSEFSGKLKKEFGKDAQMMTELLAATSPQTNVEQNFAYALDALESLKAGRFKKILPKFEQGLEMMESGAWKAWYNKEVNSGRVPNPPEKPTPATFLAHWIETHNLKPTQSNGKLYGIHSIPVLQVFARNWLDSVKGPKVKNFVQNLLGNSNEATIDVWADRTMRRIGYEGYKPRWRILPLNQGPVLDADFYFAQKAFRQAAEELGMKPDALQAALWFSEKQYWNDRGWGRLDLGDFRKEIEKTPALRAAFRQRLDKSQQSGKVKEEQLLIEPRKLKGQAQPVKTKIKVKSDIEPKPYNSNNAWGFGGMDGNEWTFPNGYVYRKGRAYFRHLDPKPIEYGLNPEGIKISVDELRENVAEWLE